jgi:hypothetical protein
VDVSELRAKIANQLGSALADWVDNKTSTDSNRPAIIAAINEFAYVEADAVLRVLAEHGDTQQVREQMAAFIDAHQLSFTAAGDLMAIVARTVAARDAAVERAGHWRQLAEKWADETTGLEANLAAARQQLDQVHDDLAAILRALGIGDHARPISSHEVVVTEVLPRAKHLRQQLDQVRDVLARHGQTPLTRLVKAQAILAPARPAGHDESGQ